MTSATVPASRRSVRGMPAYAAAATAAVEQLTATDGARLFTREHGKVLAEASFEIETAPMITAILGSMAEAALTPEQIDPQARELLGMWMGRDLAALDAEIEKLSLYVGERATITVEDVGAVVTATAGPVAFAMVNAIRAGDRAGALKELNKALRVRGDELAALGLLAWHVRQCLEVQQAVAAGRRPDLGKTPYHVVNNLIAMVRRRGRRKLQADMRSLIDADLGMKSGRAPKGTLQELVIALCS